MSPRLCEHLSPLPLSMPAVKIFSLSPQLAMEPAASTCSHTRAAGSPLSSLCGMQRRRNKANSSWTHWVVSMACYGDKPAGCYVQRASRAAHQTEVRKILGDQDSVGTVLLATGGTNLGRSMTDCSSSQEHKGLTRHFVWPGTATILLL